MVKSKTKKRTSGAKAKQATEKRIRAALESLQSFYRLGQKVVRADQKSLREKERERGEASLVDDYLKTGEGYVRGVAKSIAEEQGLSPVTVSRARNFARAYDRQELRELCQTRLPNGMPLRREHVVVLCRVKNRKHRNSLQRQAAREGWSPKRLSLEVKQVLPAIYKKWRPRDVGRDPVIPQSTVDALQQLEGLLLRWERWYAILKDRKTRTGKPCKVGLSSLPRSLREKIRAVNDAIEQAHEAVVPALEKELGSQ